jgi:hypothetical protein
MAATEMLRKVITDLTTQRDKLNDERDFLMSQDGILAKEAQRLYAIHHHLLPGDGPLWAAWVDIDAIRRKISNALKLTATAVRFLDTYLSGLQSLLRK